MTATADLKAAAAILVASCEAIREAREIPEGNLYAVLMSRLDLSGFERMVQMLLNTGLVTRTGHLLRWAGPEIN